jgi:hypothetical protein
MPEALFGTSLRPTQALLDIVRAVAHFHPGTGPSPEGKKKSPPWS